MKKTLSDILSLNFPLQQAYLIIGEPKNVVAELKVFLEERFGTAFTSSANPDFSLKEFPTWGVDESRELKTFQSRRAITWPVKVSIIVPEIITTQAQNSLLKTLEEPSDNTHFFIVTRRLDEYLPTVISRCQVIKLETGIFASELVELATDWLSADITRRFDLNKIILKQQEDSPTHVLDWLNCLFDVYWSKGVNLSDKNILMSAQSLSDAIFYANSRGSSLRVILEHLAGVVAVV